MDGYENTSPEYQAAINAHNEAIRAYEGERDLYRAIKIDDARFSVAQVAKAAADEAFDKAYAIETGHAQENANPDEDKDEGGWQCPVFG